MLPEKWRPIKAFFLIALWVGFASDGTSAFGADLDPDLDTTETTPKRSSRSKSSDSLLDEDEPDSLDESSLDEPTAPLSEDRAEAENLDNATELDSTEEEIPEDQIDYSRTKRPVFKPAPPPRAPETGKRLTTKDISIEEVEDYDPNRHWLTGQFSLLRNLGTDGSYGYYAGAGARYGYTFFKDIFFYSKAAQDSLAFELGVFGVKLANIQTEGDSYTVVPIIFTGRYNIALSENWIVFLYGGVVNNVVLNSSEADGAFLSAIQSPPPAIGVGLFLLVGPYWYARLDVGLDQIGMGLTLRF